jgi:transcriptional regulator with XRE-family HTH domain
VQIPNLRELRELHGLTQKELADVSGVSLRSVAGYEGGAHVRPNTARKLAQALNVEVVDLVGADSYPKAQAPPSQRSLFNGLEEVRRSSKTVTGGAHLSGTGKLTAAGEVVARIMQIMDKRREEKISDEEVVEQIRELVAA